MKPKQINKSLTESQKRILFDKGTEPAFSGKFVHDKEKGIYKCANCGNPLFSSGVKYDPGCGWPSFWEPISDTAVEYRKDLSFGMDRTEVICKNCGGHLGHVFTDGPKPTGQRFCINSLSLDKE
ncbi:peptide-methionine (R)-S-oxide reductase MsrB [bacterium]|nr:peptide-methionine (R)-S-oxide reductase MsrB [bacterium]